MKSASFLIGCLAVGVVAGASFGATLNVEEGTTTTGWYDSLNDAIDNAQEDDLIYVYPGTYTDEITHQIPSGVTIRGRYSNDRPIIQAPSGSTLTDVFRLDRSGESDISFINLIIDACHVTLTGVKITGNSTQGYSKNILIANCVVKRATEQGIHITDECTGCVLTGLTVHDNGSTSLHHGIYAQETVTIKDCEIHNNASAGVHLWRDGKIGPTGTKVYRNELYDNGSYDICAGNGDDFEIYNNIIYTTDPTPPGLDEGIRVIGNGADNASGHMIYHNTIYNKTKGIVFANVATDNTEIKNCIMYLCTTNIDEHAGGENPTEAYNLEDTDPGFVNAPSDLHITSTSAAIDYCPTLTAVGDDYDTDDRTGCQADAGADEY